MKYKILLLLCFVASSMKAMNNSSSSADSLALDILSQDDTSSEALQRTILGEIGRNKQLTGWRSWVPFHPKKSADKKEFGSLLQKLNKTSLTTVRSGKKADPVKEQEHLALVFGPIRESADDYLRSTEANLHWFWNHSRLGKAGFGLGTVSLAVTTAVVGSHEALVLATEAVALAHGIHDGYLAWENGTAKIEHQKAKAFKNLVEVYSRLQENKSNNEAISESDSEGNKADAEESEDESDSEEDDESEDDESESKNSSSSSSFSKESSSESS